MEAEMMDLENPVANDSDVKESLTNGGTRENGPGNPSEEGRSVFSIQRGKMIYSFEDTLRQILAFVWRAHRIFNNKYAIIVLWLWLLVSIITLVTVLIVKLQATPGPSNGCPSSGTATPDPSGGCSPGWTENEDSCYLFSKEMQTWNVSQNNCSSYAASLVKPHSKQERAFIKKEGDDGEYWIDLKRKDKEQEWAWPDNSSVIPSVHGDGLCGYLNDGELSSTDCDNTRHWICKKPVHH